MVEDNPWELPKIYEVELTIKKDIKETGVIFRQSAIVEAQCGGKHEPVKVIFDYDVRP